MEFVRLSKYAPQLVSTMDARVRRFVQGVSPLVVNEAATMALHSDMNYGKIVGFAQATEARKLKIRLYSCFAKLDCRTRVMRLEFPNELVIEWKGNGVVPKGKANVVPDALSQKSMGSLAHLGADQRPLAREVYQLASLGVRISTSDEGKVMVRNGAKSSLIAEVKEKQLIDPALAQIKEAVLNNKTSTFSLGSEDGELRCQGRLCVPDVDNLRGRVMAEGYNFRYSVHQGSTKMYRDLMEIYWWNGMRRGVADFVSKCPNCQQVKAEHQRPGGLTQLMEIPMWKWEMINMDFLVGLPHTQRKFDSIWVIVDRLTKLAHFLPVKSTDTVEQYAQLYIKELVRLHGTPLSII
ncbi:uncharacterized protein LOC142181975 [Nicotiana tabacum]|uniref:Uncharacterized protein LOC142181975 n=1 Tax=Nicotiana tabacum TaxID=4097 RepID=A0AC58URJ4_TOBAC